MIFIKRARNKLVTESAAEEKNLPPIITVIMITARLVASANPVIEPYKTIKMIVNPAAALLLLHKSMKKKKKASATRLT